MFALDPTRGNIDDQLTVSQVPRISQLLHEPNEKCQLHALLHPYRGYVYLVSLLANLI